MAALHDNKLPADSCGSAGIEVNNEQDKPSYARATELRTASAEYISESEEQDETVPTSIKFHT
jgi:hypothetical protein